MEFHLYNSTNKLKKYMVKFVNDATGKINTIHFGQKGYTDHKRYTNNAIVKIKLMTRCMLDFGQCNSFGMLKQ